MASIIPTRCIERRPTPQTVWFAGTPINLVRLANSYVPPLDPSYLSRIFSGDRAPSIAYARRLADGLGMQLQAFLDELEKCQRVSSLTNS